MTHAAVRDWLTGVDSPAGDYDAFETWVYEGPTAAAVDDLHELEGLRLRLDTQGRGLPLGERLLRQHGLSAWEACVLAALEERAGVGARATTSELVDRLRPGAGADDREAVEGAVASLRRRGAVAVLRDGGVMRTGR